MFEPSEMIWVGASKKEYNILVGRHKWKDNLGDLDADGRMIFVVYLATLTLP
jgi:hypothetical protein